jgi:hypothetical protein
MALIVAGTRLPPSNGASFLAARIAAAMSRTRFRPSSTVVEFSTLRRYFAHKNSPGFPKNVLVMHRLWY